MPLSKRQPNFELLRSIAMLMVVVLHYLNDAQLLPERLSMLSDRQVLGTMLESFCIVAVNVYVLISGYFCVRAGFKPVRLLRLIAQVLFYSLLIPLILALLGFPILAKEEGVYGLIQYILPLSTEHYWFATEYVLLYLFSPFINSACEKLTKKQLGTLITLLLIAFCGIKSIVPVALVTDRQGYDFGWFLCLYIIGCYLRLHGLSFLEKQRRGWLLYIGSASGIGLLTCVLHYLYVTKGWFDYFFRVPFHYNFILTALGAVGLFGAFAKIKIPEGRWASLFRFLGPLSLGVYLLHMHIDLRFRWYQWTQLLFGGNFLGEERGLLGLILNMILTVLLVYTIGILVEYGRCKIFGLFEGVGRKLWKRLSRKG
ncbi:MAG: acyltransferase [Lachnospiraceae bacterium]|jgi:surface polysaccharide O-acyltransferase-like enzyme|nr:acyltransferase [Lachnospiraceae bacterium]